MAEISSRTKKICPEQFGLAQFAFLERAVHLEQQNIDVLRTCWTRIGASSRPYRTCGKRWIRPRRHSSAWRLPSGTAAARGGQECRGPRGRDPRSANEIKADAT